MTTLNGPPPWLRWVHQFKADRSHAADCDDSRIGTVADDPIIMRCSGDAANVAPGGDRHAGRRVKVVSAIAPPDAGYHDAQPIGNVGVRRTHVARPPAHECEVYPGRLAGLATT